MCKFYPFQPFSTLRLVRLTKQIGAFHITMGAFNKANRCFQITVGAFNKANPQVDPRIFDFSSENVPQSAGARPCAMLGLFGTAWTRWRWGPVRYWDSLRLKRCRLGLVRYWVSLGLPLSAGAAARAMLRFVETALIRGRWCPVRCWNSLGLPPKRRRWAP